MWYLTSNDDHRIIYVVPQRSEVILGRSPDTQICTFAILDDPSISRKHATLSLSEGCLFVQDSGSRYGTFVNDSGKLEVNCKEKLNVNDVVKFGKMNCVWTVQEMNLTTCTSTLKGENLQNMKTTLAKIGGIIKSDWDDSCTYLTMPAITLTIKVVLAMVQGSYIVTTEFWNKCLEAVNNNVKLPDPGNYTPAVVESTLNKEVVCFLPNEQRKEIFSGKKFVFFSKRQYEMYKTVLIKSSAEPLLLSDTKMSKSALCERNIVVIQYNISNTTQETQAQRNQINDIVNYLKGKDMRLIADAEIGLAILYCSTNKYCNPEFNFSTTMVKQSPAENNMGGNVLAQESQDAENAQDKRKNIVINESLVSKGDSNASGNGKRKISEVTDDIETNVNKKLAADHGNITNQNVNKRKFDDNDTIPLNPTKKIATDLDDNDDFFNFLNPVSVNEDQSEKVSEKKLNLSKPLKRKADFDSNDDDLFNFIKLNEKSTDDNAKQGKFAIHKDEQNNINDVSVNEKNNITPQDISAMRGAKLEELMKNNKNWDTDVEQKIKKELSNDIEEKMNELDLGTTIVIIRDDLIVKKEPIELRESINEAKNFKKFKKVWPVKMQVTIIPKSSMRIVVPGSNDTSTLCDEDIADENI